MDSLYPIHFLRPLWLSLLPLLLLGHALARPRLDSLAPWRKLIAPHLLAHLHVPGQARSQRLWPLLLPTLAVLAAAGPSWTYQPPPFAEQRAPLIIALDLSSSMASSDLRPSRFERARSKLHDLLDRRQGARTALLAYAGTAHMLLPLSDDPSLLGYYLDGLSPELMPRPGKDTTAALAALDQMQRQEPSPVSLLLITDSVEPAARHTLNERPVVIWAATADAEALANTVEVPVVPMRLDSSDLDRLEARLNDHYRAQLQSSAGSHWQDQGWWLLWPVAVLLLLRFRRMAPVLLLLLVFGPAPEAEAGEWRFWQLWRTPDQQAQRLFDRGDFAAAAALYQDPQWQGIAYYRAGDYASAAQAFSVENTPHAHYNQGNALAMLGRYPDAIAQYRQALTVRPNWQQAQDNLGLLLNLLEQPRAPDNPGEPNLPPDGLQSDPQLRRAETEASQHVTPEEQAQIWLDSLDANLSGYLRNKMALQLQQRESHEP